MDPNDYRVKMQNRMIKEDSEELDIEVDVSDGQYYNIPSSSQPGPSSPMMPVLEAKSDILDDLEAELHAPQLNVQEIGRIIALGITDKKLNDENLQELAKKMAKNIHSVSNINIWSLADELNKGIIDSRLVVVGNAFLWNLLKMSMSGVRDKFDHYHFKMTSQNTRAADATKLEFQSARVQAGQYVIMQEGIFRRIDLYEVYSIVVFRKTGDLASRSKQFIKAYLTNATQPKCAIWHYSLRLSGTSHKKVLQDMPHSVLETLYEFMLALVGLAADELNHNLIELNTRGRFFMSLGDTDEAREAEFENMKAARDALVKKFRTTVADVLNEIREMPYNTGNCELLPPPRGKPVDTLNCVTWRQYESVLKQCEANPCQENLMAKRDLDYKLMLNYQAEGDDGLDDEEDKGDL